MERRYLKDFVALRGLGDERSLLLVGLADGVVAVAAEVAAGGGAVLLPGVEADPTKVELALAALDVVAALVLLDGRAAAGAGLAVRHQPIAVGRLLRVAARRAQLLRLHFRHLTEASATQADPFQSSTSTTWNTLEKNDF